MAIAYKSQGAGVATETSGAALSPACPATVDAGDILLLHIFWEGTTTAPSPPGDWTLLSGPHVIQTTIARHWVYGKIADGTEDGATVACGSPAVTTQRAARIYSFSGRTSGTIAELVKDFTHISNANDPQGPSVTTTKAGALAVALVAQNDNNTIGAFTGQSGGTWAEAVAEFTANLTPGLLLQIQTCTPTGDPGSVSGGSFNTTNDPCGTIGFQILPDASVSVTPDVGAPVVTGLAPTAQVTDHKNLTPGVGEVAVSGLAPTAVGTDHKNVSPGVGEVVVTGLAPTAQVSSGTDMTPGLGEVSVSGLAPTFQTTDHKSVTPAAGSMDVAGLAPIAQVTDHKTVTPAVGEPTVTGFAPTAQVSDHKEVTPALGQVAVAGQAPTVQVSDHKSLTPGVAAVQVQGLAPEFGTTDPKTMTPGVAELSVTGFAPTVSVGEPEPEPQVEQLPPETGGGAWVPFVPFKHTRPAVPVALVGSVEIPDIELVGRLSADQVLAHRSSKSPALVLVTRAALTVVRKSLKARACVEIPEPSGLGNLKRLEYDEDLALLVGEDLLEIR